MTQLIDGVMLLLSSSLVASILGKATLVATLGLMGAWLARGSPAAVRHAVLAASLAVLLALPVASLLIKPIRIALSASTQEWALPFLFPAPMDSARSAAAMSGSVGAAPAAQRWPGFSPSAALLAVWVAGGAFFLLRMIFGLQQVRALRQFGLPWRDGQTIVNHLALDAGIHRPVEVLLHESLSVPVTCGVVRPAIVLPPDSQAWEPEDLNRAIVMSSNMCAASIGQAKFDGRTSTLHEVNGIPYIRRRWFVGAGVRSGFGEGAYGSESFHRAFRDRGDSGPDPDRKPPTESNN